MSDLENQVKLLNEYVRTLQKQNQSKTNEIRTLTSLNDQLVRQCQSLRLRSHQQTPANNTTIVLLQSTIEKLQNDLKQSKTLNTFSQSNQQLTTEIQRLREEIRRITEEKLIFQQYKQKLQKQFREIGFMSSDSYVQNFKSLSVQVEEMSKKIRTYESKVVDYERKLTLLTNEVTIKNSQIQRLNHSYKTITENVQKKSIQGNQNYQQKISQYENKISQMSNIINVGRSEIERLKEKEGQLVVVMRENQNLKREVQSLNVKITSISNTLVQTNSYQTTISSLRNEQKQWQRERQQLQIKISDLQTELVEKSNTIGQLRLRQDFVKTKQSVQNLKDKEIENLTNVIRVLKAEIQDHKRTIQMHESANKNLQNRIQSIEYSKSIEISASIERVVNEKNYEISHLVEQHNQRVTQLSIQIERLKSISISNSQSLNQLADLREENDFLKRESQNNQLLIQQLQREKENLKIKIRELEEQLSRSRMANSQVKTFVTKNETTEKQLTKIVRELRSELEQVKRSNAFIHEDNHKMHLLLTEISQSQAQIPYFGNQSSILRYHTPQNITSFHQQMINSPSQIRIQNESQLRKSKHFHQPYFMSQMNIEKKKQQRNDRSAMSPVRDVKSPNLNNRQKWETLQRKISALRIQNDQLKRALLYE